VALLSFFYLLLFLCTICELDILELIDGSCTAVAGR
jgi:hypothetical protein